VHGLLSATIIDIAFGKLGYEVKPMQLIILRSRGTELWVANPLHEQQHTVTVEQQQRRLLQKRTPE